MDKEPDIPIICDDVIQIYSLNEIEQLIQSNPLVKELKERVSTFDITISKLTETIKMKDKTIKELNEKIKNLEDTNFWVSHDGQIKRTFKRIRKN